MHACICVVKVACSEFTCNGTMAGTLTDNRGVSFFFMFLYISGVCVSCALPFSLFFFVLLSCVSGDFRFLDFIHKQRGLPRVMCVSEQGEAA